MRSLLNSLAPLIGVEVSRGNKSVPPGWAKDVTPEQISEWRKQGNELVLQELEDLFQGTCAEEYRILMHKVCQRFSLVHSFILLHSFVLLISDLCF